MSLVYVASFTAITGQRILLGHGEDPAAAMSQAVHVLNDFEPIGEWRTRGSGAPLGPSWYIDGRRKGVKVWLEIEPVESLEAQARASGWVP